MADFWASGQVDLGIDGRFDYQMAELCNRAQRITQGSFADIVAESYMDSVVPVVSPTSGNRLAATASWTAATSLLTATMAANFSSSDVGKFVVFNDGVSVYGGTILQFLTTTTVTLQGYGLPAGNIASLTYVLVLNTLPASNMIDISSVLLLRYGQQLNLQLQSTATEEVEVLKREAFARWQSGTENNKNSIAWTLVGNTIYLKKGSLLANYGTTTLWHPRLALLRVNPTDYMDLLDGAMMEIGVITLRGMIAKRANISYEADKQDLQQKIVSLYQQLGGAITKEKTEQVIEALV
jgi:hypothetical protein